MYCEECQAQMQSAPVTESVNPMESAPTPQHQTSPVADTLYDLSAFVNLLRAAGDFLGV